MIRTSEFVERREKLYAKLNDHSLLVLFSGRSKKRSADEDYNFSVNRNFYYYTNITQENSVLLVKKIGNQIKEYLYIDEYDEVKEKWTGKRITKEQAVEASGISNVLYTNTFEPQFNYLLTQYRSSEKINFVYFDIEKENKILPETSIEDYSKKLQFNYPSIKVINIYDTIVRQRMVKTPAEIEEFKEAVSKTNMALQKVIRRIEPNIYEYQLSSLFYYAAQDYDFSELSFPTICASGANAIILHYPTPVGKVNAGDLVLFDLGIQNNFYCADISRTFPVDGKFTELQRIIYSIVLECNKMLIKEIKPGVTLKELNEKAKIFLKDECVKHKLMKGYDDIGKYYYHSCSHHIGLDTHDPGDRDLPLEPGNIISDEPGLYFKEYGIGVRIEDDILVTEEGSYNLSSQIIKEIPDIEAAFASNKK